MMENQRAEMATAMIVIMMAWLLNGTSQMVVINSRLIREEKHDEVVTLDAGANNSP